MKRDFRQLTDRHFDLLVAGGGIYGAWVGYDAALRGLSVALIDQGDWANATSSASSKLVHGGLRYLETLDFKLVRKSLAERQMLLDAAPHRVWPLRFGVPVYADSRVGALRMKAGLTLYDFFAGSAGDDMAHRRHDVEDFTGHFPFLNDQGLKCGFIYSDAQTDDARMVLELVDGAASLGAVCVNYCRMSSLVEQEGNAVGAIVQDVSTGAEGRISARQIVNASGSWMVYGGGKGEDYGRCRLTKGVHLVLPSCGVEEALLLTAKSDGRVFFILPWYGRTLVGTTDTDYRGSLDRVAVETEDVGYLLAAANRYLKQGWSETDVIGSYAGLRALKYSDVAAPSAASRDWKLETAPNGVHYSIGGKLTSAREDASRVVDAVCARLGSATACPTGGKPFPWAPPGKGSLHILETEAVRLGVDAECAKWLVRRHGSRAEAVCRMVAGSPELAGRIVPDLPFIYADLQYCAREEMTVHLVDLLRRRLPLLILARLGRDDLLRIARRVAPVLGWDAPLLEQEVDGCVGFARP